MKPKKNVSTLETRLLILEARILQLEEEAEDLHIRLTDVEDEVFEDIPDQPISQPFDFVGAFDDGIRYTTDIFDILMGNNKKEK